MIYTEHDILNELDGAFHSEISKYYPKGNSNDIKYIFFLDLEHGYCETAGSRIHLYADSVNWAIVFEKSGYQNRGNYADIELDYVGNCIKYITDEFDGQKYISNSKNITIITPEEYERIADKDGFELIEHSTTNINVKSKTINIKYDYQLYSSLDIIGKYENPKKLMSFGGLVRYLYDTQPEVIQSSEDEIRTQLPPNIPKIMTLDQFHFSSFYDKENPPSKQELFQLIAKVLVNQDKSLWHPTEAPNNHWSNWESGNL